MKAAPLDRKEAPAQGPMRGLRVLDMATMLAAPFAGTMLADYGAEVVKLELPGKGDPFRDFPPFKDGKSLWWKAINRNKDFITLDVRKPEGLEVFKRLLPRFDVLIENFRPGTMDQWGLTREVLWALQPKLVILRVSSFGQTGPYRRRAGFARLLEAMGGLTFLTGEPDGEPMHPGYPMGDAIGGMFATVSVLAALYRRLADPDGPGEEVDLSLTEATFRLLDVLPIEYEQLGVVRERAGNRNQYSAPAAVYRTRDNRYVSLSGSTNSIFAGNARAIGRAELIDEPRFAINSQRAVHHQELNAIFAAWMAEHDLAEVLERFERHGGSIAPVYSIDQIFTDPQMQAREAVTQVSDADFGSVGMTCAVPRFANNPTRMRKSAARLGADNERVYQEALGMSDAELALLRANGVI